MNEFENQIAVVTGGAQGIGRAVAERLAAGGARVAIWDRDHELAVQTAKELGGGASAHSVDIADYESIYWAPFTSIVQSCRPWLKQDMVESSTSPRLLVKKAIRMHLHTLRRRLG